MTIARVTILAEKETLAKFRAEAKTQGYKLQDAATEAMELWLEKYRR